MMIIFTTVCLIQLKNLPAYYSVVGIINMCMSSFADSVILIVKYPMPNKGIIGNILIYGV